MPSKPAKGIEELLGKFPKERPHLSPEMAQVHGMLLRANRERATTFSKLSNYLERWMHKRVASERQRAETIQNQNVLEIGGGTLNHLKFESDKSHYDVIEPLYDHYGEKPQKTEVNCFYEDISEISDDAVYDRIISIATLEHLTDLPATVAKSGMILSESGLFQAGYPNEGGMLWGLSWRVSTGLEYWLRSGHNYAEHMRYEHVNDASEIKLIVKYFFEDCRFFQFPIPVFHLGFYTYLLAKNPNPDRCRDYLARLDASVSL
jgi:hypothetical protein